jgi:transposase
MKINTFILIIFINLLIVGCVSTNPKAEDTGYFKTIGGGFLISKSTNEIRYTYSFKSRDNLPIGSFLVVDFQNPTGEKPLKYTENINKLKNEFYIESPIVTSLEADKNYKIIITLYSDDKMQEILHSHEQYIRSYINQKELKW